MKREEREMKREEREMKREERETTSLLGMPMMRRRPCAVKALFGVE